MANVEKSRFQWVIFLLFFLLRAPAGWAAEPTVEELLSRTDDLMRGSSSHAVMTMRVKTERWQRELRMESWSEGTDQSLVRILTPQKEAGTATLKVEKEIWNYLPKVDRTIRVPSSMMSASWMGSHFTNDDLIADSRFDRDYDCAFDSVPEPPGVGHWTIDCRPKPTAPVVWGKVMVRIRAEDQIVDQVTFFDERDALMRTMLYQEIREIGGRRLPSRVRMVPADKPDEFTEMSYDELELDIDLPERTFSLQSLRR